MKDGFIKVSAGTPDVRVADCEYNADQIIAMVGEMKEKGARIMVFPELCITAYTCGDLFWQENLLREAKAQLLRIAEETEDVDGLIFVGLPLEYKGSAGERSWDLCPRSTYLIITSFMREDILPPARMRTDLC